VNTHHIERVSPATQEEMKMKKALVLLVSLGVFVMSSAAFAHVTDMTISQVRFYYSSTQYTHDDAPAYNGSCGTNCYLYTAYSCYNQLVKVYAKVTSSESFDSITYWYGDLDSGNVWSNSVDSHVSGGSYYYIWYEAGDLTDGSPAYWDYYNGAKVAAIGWMDHSEQHWVKILFHECIPE
jgi:hypothetical protein